MTIAVSLGLVSVLRTWDYSMSSIQLYNCKLQRALPTICETLRPQSAHSTVDAAYCVLGLLCHPLASSSLQLIFSRVVSESPGEGQIYDVCTSIESCIRLDKHL